MIHKVILAAFATILHLVKSENPEGFISIGCGLSSIDTPYIDPLTNLAYISDATFIQRGEIGEIHENMTSLYVNKAYTVLRYFRVGIRNCYSLSVSQNTRYLIRALFLYGNYDGHNSPPKFDLYFGPNLWATVDLRKSKSDEIFYEEIIYTTRSSFLEVCLVKTGTTTPFISAIEIRPLGYNTYIAETDTLKYFNRLYFTNSDQFIRYPQDSHDRIWVPYSIPEWTHAETTTNVIDSSRGYDPPQVVLRTGAMPTNSSDPMKIAWYLENAGDKAYVYIYIAEITQMPVNETREFQIVWNDKVRSEPYHPMKFEAYIVFNTEPVTCEGAVCHVKLVRTPSSTLPPLMNALELYTIIEFPQPETDQNDVIALRSIQSTYQLKRISWQGDPCVPVQFAWTGLYCNVTPFSTPPRIMKLDLSSSGLQGFISPSIRNLNQLQELDLSKNNLTGEVPEFLAEMKSLMFINLSGNNFRGYVPQALLDRQKNGLKLLVDKNILECVSCDKKIPVAAVIAPVSAVAAIIIIVFATVLVLRRRKPPALKVIRSSFKSKTSRVTYSEVQEITKNFQTIIGKGGFGSVYHGFLQNKQVAVKVLSESSRQGYKEFSAEVELLLKVHHVNLVSLIGYCDDGTNFALIYELMGNGNLQEHLLGERGDSILSWRSRLKIAVEAATGIEYLHVGCKPQIVHRDIKTANILLGEQFEAKIADFGHSKPFQRGNDTQISSKVAGTFGYMDPEYHRTLLLSDKSDIYSFGVVLLELISGQRAVDMSREDPNIVNWTKRILSTDDIENVVDPYLFHQDYDISSARKALNLAMSCVNSISEERPRISQVVHELSECLEMSENWSGDVDSRSSLLKLVFDKLVPFFIW